MDDEEAEQKAKAMLENLKGVLKNKIEGTIQNDQSPFNK